MKNIAFGLLLMMAVAFSTVATATLRESYPPIGPDEVVTVLGIENKAGNDSLEGKDQQNYQLDNSIFTNLWTHPAYAGSEGKNNINIYSRMLWLRASVSSPWQLMLAYDGSINKAGLGGFLLHESNPTYDYTKVNLAFAWNIAHSNRTNLRLGLAVSPLTRISTKHDTVDTFGDQIHPQRGPIYDSNEILYRLDMESYMELGAGAWFTHGNFFTGLSIHNFQPFVVVRDNHRSGMGVLWWRNMWFGSIIGHHFEIKDFKVIPNISTYYFLYTGLTYEPGLTFSYKDKYMVGLNSNPNFYIVALSAGAIIHKRIRLMISSGRYKNPFLHEITGLAFLNIATRFQF